MPITDNIVTNYTLETILAYANKRKYDLTVENILSNKICKTFIEESFIFTRLIA